MSADGSNIRDVSLQTIPTIRSTPLQLGVNQGAKAVRVADKHIAWVRVTVCLVVVRSALSWMDVALIPTKEDRYMVSLTDDPSYSDKIFNIEL